MTNTTGQKLSIRLDKIDYTENFKDLKITCLNLHDMTKNDTSNSLYIIKKEKEKYIIFNIYFFINK